MTTETSLTVLDMVIHDNYAQNHAFYPLKSEMIHLPNQRNAFFASGFNLVDPTQGGLDKLYEPAAQKLQNRADILHRRGTLSMDQSMHKQYVRGKSNLDYTNSILKQIKR